METSTERKSKTEHLTQPITTTLASIEKWLTVSLAHIKKQWNEVKVDDAVSEYKKYLKEKVPTKKYSAMYTNPFKYWSSVTASMEYPTLKRLALYVLTPNVSTGPIEGLFSRAGRILNPHGGSLKKLNEIIVMHSVKRQKLL